MRGDENGDYIADDRPETYKPTETFDDLTPEEFDALYYARFGKYIKGIIEPALETLRRKNP